MRSLEAKKVQLEKRVRNIVSIHNKRHLTLINLQAQTNSEHLIALIETCRRHNQLVVCQGYADQFETNPNFQIPDFI